MAIGYTCFATTSPGSLHGPWGLQKPIGDRGSPVCKLGLCIYYLSAWVYVLAKSNLCIYILLLLTIIFIITIVFMILIIVIFVIVIINIIMYGAYIYIYTHTIIISIIIIITIIIILYYIYVCVRVSPGKSTINLKRTCSILVVDLTGNPGLLQHFRSGPNTPRQSRKAHGPTASSMNYPLKMVSFHSELWKSIKSV